MCEFCKHFTKRTGKGERTTHRIKRSAIRLRATNRARCTEMSGGKHFENAIRSRCDCLGDRRRETRPIAVRRARLDRDHRRCLGLDEVQLHRDRADIVRSLPCVNDALVEVPTVVHGDEGHINANLARKADETREVRLPELRIKTTPRIFDANCDHRP
jgi:hypothetical protein